MVKSKLGFLYSVCFMPPCVVSDDIHDLPSQVGKGIESISEVEAPLGQILFLPVIGWSWEW
jgi:hypothetical protein